MNNCQKVMVLVGILLFSSGFLHEVIARLSATYVVTTASIIAMFAFLLGFIILGPNYLLPARVSHC